MAEKCKECGCECANCTQENQRQSDMHLHVEIENLRQRLLERDNHIVTMETQFLNEADKFPNGELASMKEELLIWQEKYSRLHEAHKRVQKVNQNLEDKLLRIVDKCETEKGAFTKDIATLSHRLADANYTIHRLTQDNEKYRNDVNLAIQLLQCKPSYFVGQKYDSLPSEVQAKVRTYVAQKRRSSDVTSSDVKSITVPISTFPPTAMVYNVTKPPTVEKHSDDDEDKSKPPVDVVSAAIMAKVLEDREKDRIFAKHCDTCTCHRSILTVDAETQTNISDNPFCDECTTKCTKYMMNTVSPEINENTINGKVQSNNSSCTNHTNCQSLCAKDKFVSKNNRSIGSLKDDNLNKKNLIHRSDVPTQVQDLSENITKQMTFQKINDTCNVARINSEKAKHIKASKKSDNYADSKSNTNYWNKLEKMSNHNQTAFEFPEKHATRKEQTHVDIINDRLWKNEWTKLKSEANFKDTKNKNKINNDVEIDIINDRDWKNDRSELRNPTQLTLIEVKNLDNINQNDSGQTDIATSPSFSSDSIVISTSDPSSSSSDVVQSITGTQLTQNINNLKSNFQNRLTGPRNCLVRVTPGSKNILLDNAGHYKTVLYTSGTKKPNTALVHSKKLSRFGSERSISTSSEENSPILLQDNNQLQRVAEWVQSSVCIESGVTNDNNKLRSSENVLNEGSSLVYINESESNCKIQIDDEMSSCVVKKIMYDQSIRNVEISKQKGISCDTNNLSSSSDIDYLAEEKDKDLITFDVSNEEEKTHKSLNKSDSKDLNYEVKITKEMEETYLKLAASLDPVALNLSSSNNADLTIEKYRKDHKRLHIQKIQDRAGSKI